MSFMRSDELIYFNLFENYHSKVSKKWNNHKYKLIFICTYYSLIISHYKLYISWILTAPLNFLQHIITIEST